MKEKELKERIEELKSNLKLEVREKARKKSLVEEEDERALDELRIRERKSGSSQEKQREL